MLAQPDRSVPLRIDNVTYRYGATPALAGVSFAVASGGVSILLGPNGAGKTTLFSLICRLLALQGGEIQLNGRSLRTGDAALLGSVGVVFQQPTLDLDLTVRQNLHYFAALHGLPRRDADQRIADELKRLEFTGSLDRRVRTLSGGHRRRIEIARALICQPALLLLDEPTVGLDAPTRAALVDLVHRQARDRGLAVLWATHLLDEAWPDDRLVVLAGGQVRAAGTVGEVAAAAGAASLDAAFNKLIAGPVGEFA